MTNPPRLRLKHPLRLLLAALMGLAVVAASGCGGGGGGGSKGGSANLNGQPPAPPTGLSASGANGSVTLSWTASTGATAYVVLRSTTSGGPYAAIGTTSNTSFTDTTAANLTTYYYVVRADDAAGSSGDSTEVSATPSAGPASTPSGVAAFGGLGQITVDWSASSGATAYAVLRSTTPGGPYSPAGFTRGTTFTDTGLSSGAAYDYVVQALGPGGDSIDSSEVSAVTLPAAPTGLGAQGAPGRVSLTWSASTGATAYVVLRGASAGGPYAPIGSASGLSYTDTSVSSGATYHYVVQAANASGVGGTSTEVSATTPPAAPTLTGSPGNAQVLLSWTASAGAASYTVLSSTTSGGPYTTRTSTGATAYADQGLTDGTTYFYVVQAVDAGGASPDSNERSLTPLASYPPPAPAGLTAQGGNKQVALSWNASYAATGYAVYRSTTSGGPYSGPVLTTSATSATDSGLANGTAYYYVVEAADAGGLSADSNEASATTVSPPPPPAGLTASTGDTRVSLAWNGSSGATAYVVYRSSGGPYVPVGSTTATSYVDTGLTDGTTYSYQVEAVNDVGASAPSTTSSAVPLAVPTGVSAAGTTREVDLSWTAPSGATGYAVYRSTTSGGPYTLVGTTASTSFKDTGLLDATTYYYVVQAGFTQGTSAGSTEVSARTAGPPPAPANVAAFGGDTQVTVRWDAALSATNYVVLRSTTSGSGYVSVGSTAATRFVDTSVVNQTTYYYVVQAQNASGTSPDSSEASATTTPDPGAPANLVAVGGYGEISLGWTAGSNATGYTVFRAGVSGGPYSPIGTTPATSYTDSGLSNGATWYYVVQSADSVGTSAYSNEATATTAPPTPTGLTATGGDRQISLQWNPASGATAYVIYSALQSWGPWNPVGTTSAASYVALGLSPGTDYDFTVQAANAAGLSPTSAVAQAMTLPAPPTSLQAAGGYGEISLAWTAGTGATSYVVSRGAGPGGPFSPVGTTTWTSFTDLGLSNGATWVYVVQGVDAGGTSAYSNEATATTAPPQPTGLTAAGGDQQVSLQWNPASGATAYVVYSALESWGPWSPLGTTSAASYVALGLSPGTPYSFTVQAANAAGSSPTSAVAGAMTFPAAPTGLTAAPLDAGALLQWNAAVGATAYVVYRSTSSGGPYAPVATVATTSATDTGLVNNTTYDYEVSAVDSAGEGPRSPFVAVTPIPPPPPPTGITAVGGAQEVTLQWGAVGGATAYAVFRSPVSGTGYAEIATTASTSYLDGSLASGTTYYYVLASANAIGLGSYSTEVTAVTLPDAPTGVTATPGNHVVALSWTASTGATGYEVSRSTVQGGPHSPLAATSATTYVDSSAVNGTTYYYVVQAADAAGLSPSSVEVSGTPQGEICVAMTNVFSGGPAGSEVLTFSSSQNGDGAPLRSFGDVTGLRSTFGIAVDNVNNEVVVANSGDSTLRIFARTASGDAPPLRVIHNVISNFSSPAVDPTHDEIWIPDGISTVSVYARLATPYAAPLRTISGGNTGLNWPSAVTVDTVNDEAIVANYSNNEILVFPRTASGNVSPIRTITPTSGFGPSGIAVDPVDGEFIVSDTSSNVIAVFDRTATGTVSPLWTITLPGLANPSELAYDAVHDLVTVASYANGGLYVYPRTATGNATPYLTIAEANGGVGAAADGLNGELYYTHNTGSNPYAFISVYPTSSSVLSRRIWLVPGGVVTPQGLALDRVHDELWVANDGPGAASLGAFARTATGNVGPLRQIAGLSTALNSPRGVTVDTVNDEVIATDSNAIRVYPRTASGDVAPIRTISGPTTGLASPWGVAVDATHDEIWVGNYASNSVTVYGRTASGDVPPLRSIVGPTTGLSSPTALLLDPVHDELWVANYASSSVTVYSRTATGDAPPLRVIQGPTSGMGNPEGLALDLANDDVLVGNYPSNAVMIYPRTASGDVPPTQVLMGTATTLNGVTGVALCK